MEKTENSQLQEVIQLLDTGKIAEAQAAFSNLKTENSTDYFLTAGRLHQKFQRWGKAINAYSKVIELEPGNQAAKNNLKLIRNILNFWSPDMFNP